MALNIGLCKDCRFWGVHVDRVCHFDGEDLMPDEQFYIDYSANDDTGLDFRLITGPNHGCIRFAARD